MQYSPLSVDDVQGININFYVNITAFTILVYDYLLTFGAEVERFWPAWRYPTWPVVMFFVNRYLTLLGHAPVTVEYFWSFMNPNKPRLLTVLVMILVSFFFYDVSASRFLELSDNNDDTHLVPPSVIYSCHALQSFHQYFAVIIQIIVATLLIMRMYALYDRSRVILTAHLVIAFAAVAVAIWAIITGKEWEKAHGESSYLFPTGCIASLSEHFAHRLAAAWSGMLVFDTMVFALTLYKAFVLRQMHGVSLITLLLRDGSVYFLVMVLANIGNIQTFLYGGTFTRGVLSTFTNVISSVMITRLMLNLRSQKLVNCRWCLTSTCSRHTMSMSTQIVSTFVDAQFTELGGTSGYGTFLSGSSVRPVDE